MTNDWTIADIWRSDDLTLASTYCPGIRSATRHGSFSVYFMSIGFAKLRNHASCYGLPFIHGNHGQVISISWSSVCHTGFWTQIYFKLLSWWMDVTIVVVPSMFQVLMWCAQMDDNVGGKPNQLRMNDGSAENVRAMMNFFQKTITLGSHYDSMKVLKEVCILMRRSIILVQ